MKKLFVFMLSLLLLVPLARTALAAPAAPEAPARVTGLPFKGTIQSLEIYSNVVPTTVATATGSGEATQIGRFAVSYKVEWNLLDLSTADTAYFITPNGDSLQAKGVGQAITTQTPGSYNVIEIYTITGGTGHYEGASGTFTLKRLVSLTTGAAASTFEGTLLIP